MAALGALVASAIGRPVRFLGKKEIFENLPVDLIYTIVEGEGIREKTRFATEAKTEKPIAPKK